MNAKTSFLKASIRLEKALFKTMMRTNYKRKNLWIIIIAFNINRIVSN